MRPLTLKTVNKHLMALGYTEELVKGNGYFYFVGQGTGNWYSTSVFVYRLNELNLNQWVDALNELRPATTE